MPLRYRITTLGCRVNHAEAREIESVLAARGLVRAPAGVAADLEVVHSCSVTNTASAKSRAAVRRAARRLAAAAGRSVRIDDRSGHQTPEAVPSVSDQGCVALPAPAPPSPRAPAVIVTGCYASTHPAEAATLTRDPRRVVPQTAMDGGTGSMLERLSEQVDAWLDRQGPSRHSSLREAAAGSSAPSAGLLPLPVIAPVGDAGPHVRAELRIQDGCDAHCTFCIIPRIRRTLRSKRVDDAVREAAMLVERGHREIVLTGIFIGAYGRETALRRRQRDRHAEPLADLLDAVAEVPGVERLRISSMEPGDLTPALLDAMVANAPVVVPHLHLPLQSGSDAILRRMNRQYAVGDYLEMIDRVEAALTVDGLSPAITTDVICGFPGETDADFAKTVAVARRVGYLHMHVFPYSPKRGTAAARWRETFVPDETKKERVRQLIELEAHPDDGLSIQYRRRLIGRTVRVIAEQPDRADPTWMTGRCDHYALVHLAPDDHGPIARGRVVQAKITEVTPERTVAEVVGRDVRLTVA